MRWTRTTPRRAAAGAPGTLLHRQTEVALHDLARRGWRVLIKPHPQQDPSAVSQWRERAGDLWGERVLLVDPGADARRLILSADVVLGFQSTALLEAMLAGRPVVYTGWDQEATAMGPDLIPFTDWGDVISVARTADGLAETIASLLGSHPSPAAMARRQEIAELYLGPLDGAASARALAVIGDEVRAWERRRTPEQNELRRRLAGRRPPLRLSRRGRAGLRIARRRLGAALGR